jgi:hypothetical protein
MELRRRKRGSRDAAAGGVQELHGGRRGPRRTELSDLDRPRPPRRARASTEVLQISMVFARLVASCRQLVIQMSNLPRHVIRKMTRRQQEAVHAPGRGPFPEDQSKCAYSSITNTSRIIEMVSTMDTPKALVLIIVHVLILTCISA